MVVPIDMCSEGVKELSRYRLIRKYPGIIFVRAFSHKTERGQEKSKQHPHSHISAKNSSQILGCLNGTRDAQTGNQMFGLRSLGNQLAQSTSNKTIGERKINNKCELITFITNRGQCLHISIVIKHFILPLLQYLNKIWGTCILLYKTNPK